MIDLFDVWCIYSGSARSGSKAGSGATVGGCVMKSLLLSAQFFLVYPVSAMNNVRQCAPNLGPLVCTTACSISTALLHTALPRTCRTACYLIHYVPKYKQRLDSIFIYKHCPYIFEAELVAVKKLGQIFIACGGGQPRVSAHAASGPSALVQDQPTCFLGMGSPGRPEMVCPYVRLDRVVVVSKPSRYMYIYT